MLKNKNIIITNFKQFNEIKNLLLILNKNKDIQIINNDVNGMIKKIKGLILKFENSSLNDDELKKINDIVLPKDINYIDIKTFKLWIIGEDLDKSIVSWSVRSKIKPKIKKHFNIIDYKDFLKIK